jgi:hypothetical protein
MARLAASLVLVVAIASGVSACSSESPSPSPGRLDRAQPLIAPPGGLPPPYDYAGVWSALRSRGMLLSLPTMDEVAQARTPPEAFLATLRATLARDYPGETLQVISVYRAVVDMNDPHGVVAHRLSYVAETSGHLTGNCFTLYDANSAEQYLAACFFGDRARPGP